jgi:glycosyltransferase involved in cell wall biosynthesis
MFAGMLAAESLKLPMIFRGEANLISPRAFWKKVIHKALLSRFTRILHIGAANLHYYQHFGVRESIFCPFFSDNERLVHDFGKLLPSRKSIREHWRIPESSTCFLFCGKLETKKRPADFIHAVEGVDGASGLVVGSGELENGIRSLSRKTVFAGFLNQTEIAKAYVAADVLVLPSDFGEVWGLVVNEAMACGLPAIVSDQVGCREDLVIEGVTGFSYPCGDVQALKAKIKRLASDEELRRVMSLNAQSRVTEIYNVENAARAVLKAVESLQC